MALLKNLLRHTATLLDALLHSEDRPGVVRLFRLLHNAPNRLSEGGLPTLMHYLDTETTVPLNSVTLKRAMRQADAVAAYMVGSPFRSCLRRSVLRYHIMRAAVQPVTLVIGVRRTDAATQLDGHAWIEQNGQPYGESGHTHDRMELLYRYPEDKDSADSTYASELTG